MTEQKKPTYFHKERKALISSIFKDIGAIIFVAFIIEQLFAEQFKLHVIIFGIIISLVFYISAVQWRPEEK